mmetsp:Transcript_25244/g.88058  ORF Transcript_25244/g.88058 Transcript_25244/m.88058 type:complete len:264 (-) Transcript_25244:1572-2363(-)
MIHVPLWGHVSGTHRRNKVASPPLDKVFQFTRCGHLDDDRAAVRPAPSTTDVRSLELHASPDELVDVVVTCTNASKVPLNFVPQSLNSIVRQLVAILHQRRRRTTRRTRVVGQLPHPVELRPAIKWYSVLFRDLRSQLCLRLVRLVLAAHAQQNNVVRAMRLEALRHVCAIESGHDRVAEQVLLASAPHALVALRVVVIGLGLALCGRNLTAPVGRVRLEIETRNAPTCSRFQGRDLTHQVPLDFVDVAEREQRAVGSQKSAV